MRRVLSYTALEKLGEKVGQAVRKWTWKEKKLHIQAVTLLVLVMVAISLLGELSTQSWGLPLTAALSRRQLETQAEELLSTMTLEEQVAQLLLVQGADAAAVAEYGFGGVLGEAELFASRSPQEVAEYFDALQQAAALPLLIAVQEEGGAVNTVSRFPQFRGVPFLSSGELMTIGGLPLVKTETADKCGFLKNLGINMNFAPMCHVTTDSKGAMYTRAFGADASHTARYVAVVAEEMKAQGVISVLESFPGYGNLTGEELPADGRGMAAFGDEGYLPFVEGIGAGAPAVLMGHTVVAAMDPQNPAAVSKAVHRQLRRELGFEGVIVSELLGQEPWAQYSEDSGLAVRALEAGSDLLVVDDGEAAFRGLLEAVQHGQISRRRLEESVLRILKLKIEYKIIS